MKQRKYTLPRHTNLAKQSSRTGAFLIDVAVFGLLTIAFLFGCFRLILNPKAEPYKKELETEQVNSHLRYRDENGVPQVIKTDSSYEEYRDVISYYYMNYLTGNVSEPGTGSRLADEPIKNDAGVEVKKSEYYTVEWFNKNILQIKALDPEEDSNCLFTYQKVDGVYDKTKIGIPKDLTKVSEADVNRYMQNVYLSTYLENFNKLSYIVDLTNKETFIYSLEIVLAMFISAVGTYIIIPIIIKKGRTLGKLSFKLALANSDGYKVENKQLIMRVIPLVVVIASFLIPFWNDIFLVILIPLIIFLVSFALAMASPKKASLHDFVARTIVIDDRTSIIFDNEIEEENYIIKEDNLETEIKENGDGEEPEISYEK